jgi:hypothetical protein
MRSADHRDPPDLIPYASHVAHGTGRTPIGIILFAASHLLLGGVIVLAFGRYMSQLVVVSAWMKLFAVATVVMAFSMLGGGTMLLMKGRGAWMLAITAFMWLAVSEIVMAALGLGWWLSQLRRSGVGFFYHAAGMAVMSSALLALCLIVLKYLGSAKARDTFALPRGDTPVVVRAMPAFLLTIFVAAMLFAGAVGADMSL